MDTETEKAIQASINFLIKGRTTISIAHRLSTVRGAHQILVLKEGGIAEKGSHEELMRRKGIYYQFWQCQERLKSWSI